MKTCLIYLFWQGFRWCVSHEYVALRNNGYENLRCWYQFMYNDHNNVKVFFMVLWVEHVKFQNYYVQQIHIDDYITHNLPLEDINEAFNLMSEGKCLRCVIHMPTQLPLASTTWWRAAGLKWESVILLMMDF